MKTHNDDPFDEYMDCDCDEDALKALVLTRDEILYIDDQLTMMIERDGRSDNFSTVRPILANAGLPAPVELLDKIGMAVLQITDENAEDNSSVTVAVTATDLYMLREIAKSTVKINGHFLGFELKKKIYKLLYESEYRLEKSLTRLLADVDMDPSTAETLDWSGE